LEDAKDIQFMAAALEQAKAGQRTPGGAQVGYVLVQNGEVVYSNFNEADLLFDPTAHAEMVGIRRLCRERKLTRLKEVTLYCTLQPCGMCTIMGARTRRATSPPLKTFTAVPRKQLVRGSSES
jgi:tRNA(adenine34) deaminase